MPFTVGEIRDGKVQPYPNAAINMEGFDFKRLDEELGLWAQGLISLVLVALGYRDEADFNADLPRSRLSAAKVFTYI